jgi:hypothetical protein
LRGKLPGALALAFATIMTTPMGLAVTDTAGDAADGSADHDIASVTMAETGDELSFTVTVAGHVQQPRLSLEDFRIDLSLVPRDLYTPGVSPQAGGAHHIVSLTTREVYGVFRQSSFGYALPVQPAWGDRSTTFHLPKAYLDATLAARPLAGDWVADVSVKARSMGSAMDTALLPDAQLATDSERGATLHLRPGGSGGDQGSLQPAAPTGSTPSTVTLLDGALEGRFASPPLTRALRLEDLSAVLWVSPTTSSPVVAFQDLHVELRDRAPGGTETLVAQRVEETSDVEGSTTNLFLAAGVPQRMPFHIVPVGGASRIPAGDQVVLYMTASQSFLDVSGPLVVYFDAADKDSFLATGQNHHPSPSRGACAGGGDNPQGAAPPQDAPRADCPQ